MANSIVNTIEIKREFNRLINVAYDKGRVDGYSQGRNDAYKKGIQKCIDTIRDKYYHDGYDEDIVGVIVRILEEIKNDN